MQDTRSQDHTDIEYSMLLRGTVRRHYGLDEAIQFAADFMRLLFQMLGFVALVFVAIANVLQPFN